MLTLSEISAIFYLIGYTFSLVNIPVHQLERFFGSADQLVNGQAVVLSSITPR